MYNKHRVVKAVNTAIKSPFLDGGRDVTIGLDCWGIVKYVADTAFQMNIPDFNISANDKNKIYLQFLEKTKNEFKKISITELRPGDFVGMNMIVAIPSLVHHFGIMIDDHRYIHTLEKQNPQLTSIHDKAYKNRIRGFYRWIGENTNAD